MSKLGMELMANVRETLGLARNTTISPTVNLLGVWMDEAERRTRFLFAATWRAGR